MVSNDMSFNRLDGSMPACIYRENSAARQMVNRLIAFTQILSLKNPRMFLVVRL